MTLEKLVHFLKEFLEVFDVGFLLRGQCDVDFAVEEAELLEAF